MHEPVADELCSPTWDGSAPRASVVIATRGRAAYLAELLDALEHQSVGIDAFEVLVCDDASEDETWKVLSEAARVGPLRLRAVRLRRAGGPGPARNLAYQRGRAPIVAFTDDDCLPAREWLDALLIAFDDGNDLVQGAVRAEPREHADAGPWDKTLWVSGPTAWFETANTAYRRSLLDELGGFEHGDGVDRRPGGLAFGEDVLLGARAVAAGARRAYAPEALVRHRCVPSSYADYLESVRRLVGFPGLAKRSALVREQLIAGVFLTTRSAAFDLALAGTLMAVARRRPIWLLAWTWYLRLVWPAARQRGRVRHMPARVAQLAYGDAVGLAWLLRGSKRQRRLVL